MHRDALLDLEHGAGEFKIISSDVFDTLLLRTSRSEQSRIALGEKLFSRALLSRGLNVPADVLVDVRRQAQHLAFRALSHASHESEVRLADIVARQVQALGLPDECVAERLRIEVDVEKQSLFANRKLGAVLRKHRAAGARIVAVSDTTLSARQLEQLIEHFHGTDLIDAVYSSADERATKRFGRLFDVVAERERAGFSQIAHVGDDDKADVRVPRSKGMRSYHIVPPRYRTYVRRLGGAMTHSRRALRIAGVTRVSAPPPSTTSHAFGHDVFGPILVQMSVLIWMYASEAAVGDKPVLLFCARGGLGMREVFERVLSRLNLPLAARREGIMISRLIAARAALLTRSPSVLDELNREFKGDTIAAVAQVLGGRAYELSAEWQRPFEPVAFMNLIFGNSAPQVLADIEEQNRLFVRHLDQLTSGTNRAILCDTGLYGSTQRLMASGFPGRTFETLQFARANYKHYGEEHFPHVTGLFVEHDCYRVLDPKTSVLRYWHLVESLFEPAIPSVRTFSETSDGLVTSNSGDVAFGSLDMSAWGKLLAGALAYVDALAPGDGAAALSKAEGAWQRLRQAITQPTPADLECLHVPGRSVDFGRPDVRDVITAHKGRSRSDRMLALKGQLWREGALACEFPGLKRVLLPALCYVHVIRAVSSDVKKTVRARRVSAPRPVQGGQRSPTIKTNT